jgi:ABC-2 type transport system permease protein
VRNLWHTFQLGLKELISLSRDPVLLFLIAYVFTFSIYTPAKSAVMDVVNASIAIVNEDDSQASRAIRDAMLPPKSRSAISIAIWTQENTHLL